MRTHTLTTTPAEEAALFCQYIIDSFPSQEVVHRYETILNSSSVKVTPKDARIIAFAHKHPRMLGAIDSYAALFMPHTEIRRRLYILFAVLESTPEHSEQFLPKDHGALYWLVIAGVSIRTVFRVLLGVIIVNYIGARR